MNIRYMWGNILIAFKDMVYQLLRRPEKNMQTADAFHYQFYNSGAWNESTWFGVRAKKCPFDLWIYQEILAERKPEVVIECGTAEGGTTLFLANLMDLLGTGSVVSIDISKAKRPTHNRITYLMGSSVSEDIVNTVKGLVAGKSRVMVILDSDHACAHVRKELQIYSPLVTKGDYLIVEDSNVNGHPVCAAHGPGPMEAIQEFLVERKDFRQDKSRERLLLTFNPGGFLKKVE